MDDGNGCATWNMIRKYRRSLSEYGSLYEQAKEAEVASDNKVYSGKTALEWLNNYEKAIKENF